MSHVLYLIFRDLGRGELLHQYLFSIYDVHACGETLNSGAYILAREGIYALHACGDYLALLQVLDTGDNGGSLLIAQVQ